MPQFCWSNGGQLAEFEYADEEGKVDTFLSRDQDYWIGLTDLSSEGTFRWVESHKEPEHSNWGPAQPDNYENQDCVVKDFKNDDSGSWNDLECSWVSHNHGIHALCQKMKQ